MLQLRISTPPELTAAVLHRLEALEVVHDLAHLPGCARRPVGDLVFCTVPRESGSAVIELLRGLGVEERGAITISSVEASLSATSEEVSAAAPGPSADAVVWEAVEAQTANAAELSVSYLVFIAVAGVLAAIALLTDSLVLIIGAMVVGPEFGPLAALCIGLARRRRELARRAAATLVLGFTAAAAAAVVATGAFVGLGMAPEAWHPEQHPATLFVSRPDAYAGVVAALAGVVGMLSLTTAQLGTLVGVFISVTTIPAAGNLGVAAAYGNLTELRGAALQLALNVLILIVAGLATLAVQRHHFARRVSGLLARLSARLGRRRRRRH